MESKWITKKELAAPIISVVAFLVLLIGASYSYYAVTEGSATGAANIANANLNMPTSKCTFATSKTDCTITSNTASSINRTDSIISIGEMLDNTTRGQVATASCNLTTTLGGSIGCAVSYKVMLQKVSGSSAYSATGTNEFTYVVSGGGITANTETNIPASSVQIGTDSLSVTTSSNATKTYTANIKFYNINANQSAIAGKTFKYQLSAVLT